MALPSRSKSDQVRPRNIASTEMWKRFCPLQKISWKVFLKVGRFACMRLFTEDLGLLRMNNTQKSRLRVEITAQMNCIAGMLLQVSLTNIVGKM